jgi:hypothetical protein
MPSSKRKKKLLVFLSHANEDKPTIRDLYHRLKDNGFEPWLDEECLLPGQDWHLEIEQAMRKSEAILVCFSEKSMSRAGYVHSEYKRAMDLQQKQPPGAIFVVPVRLDKCEIPLFLSDLQCVDFPLGYERLIKALNIRAGKSTSAQKSKVDASKEDTKQVQIVLEGAFAEFNETRREDLKSVLSAMLQVETKSIRILQVTSGSIVVDLEIPEIAVNRLRELAVKKDFRLKAIRVVSIEISGETIITIDGTDSNTHQEGKADNTENPILIYETLSPSQKAKAREFEIRINVFIAKDLPGLIDTSIPVLFHTLADKMSVDILQKVVIWNLMKWKQGDIATLDDLEPAMRDSFILFGESQECRNLIFGAVRTWLVHIKNIITENTDPICVEFGLPVQRIGMDIQESGFNFDIDNVALGINPYSDDIVIAVSLLISMAGILATVSTPLAVFVGPLLFLFGMKIFSDVRSWNLPKFMRKAILTDKKMEEICKESNIDSRIFHALNNSELKTKLTMLATDLTSKSIKQDISKLIIHIN